MEKRREADLVREECRSCHGIFLDRGEFNALLTMVSGDLEFNTGSGDEAEDTAPERGCPRCGAVAMAKRAFLGYGSVIVDVCAGCGGVYLDGGEWDSVNDSLKRFEKNGGPADFRGEIAGRFVRVEWWPTVRTPFDWAGITIPRGGEWGLVLQVFLKKPLGCGLRMSRQTWTDLWIRRMGLSKTQDIECGDPEVDAICLIQGTDPQRVVRLLSAGEIRTLLVELFRAEPELFMAPGEVTVLDDRILYVEGPAAFGNRDLRLHLERDEHGVFGRLSRLAQCLEEATEKAQHESVS
jgi:Zn-finger nucleic acid-binding protein